MGFIRVILLGLFVSSLTACTQNPEWTLFYYADTKDIPHEAKLSEHISGYYATSEHCLLKGAGMAKLSESGIGSYQCGHLCVAIEGKALSCEKFIDKLEL